MLNEGQLKVETLAVLLLLQTPERVHDKSFLTSLNYERELHTEDAECGDADSGTEQSVDHSFHY